MKVKVLISATLLIVGIGIIATLPFFTPVRYGIGNEVVQAEENNTESEKDSTISRAQASHIETPETVRAIYMSQCVAATPSFREKLMQFAEETEVNSIVIDIKDFTGTIAFESKHPLLKEHGGSGCRVSDFTALLEEMHNRDIYVIGRITVFQDPYYTKQFPEWAVKKESTPAATWTDYKGLSFVDVGARPFWDYIVAIGEESYYRGVDELNFDYIRYPSDGNIRDIRFAHSDGSKKPEELERFFQYLSGKLRSTGAVLSADLFGMTTTNTDDLNIGQQLERTLPYFDYIAPMVYPSHYPSGFKGFVNVNNHPYDIVKISMESAVERLQATTTTVKTLTNTRIGTSSPAVYTKPVYDPLVLRPWLQDFDYPVPYTPDMVDAQIQAIYDVGLNSWMMWDPANTYTRSVYSSATALE